MRFMCSENYIELAHSQYYIRLSDQVQYKGQLSGLSELSYEAIAKLIIAIRM